MPQNINQFIGKSVTLKCDGEFLAGLITFNSVFNEYYIETDKVAFVLNGHELTEITEVNSQIISIINKF